MASADDIPAALERISQLLSRMVKDIKTLTVVDLESAHAELLARNVCIPIWQKTARQIYGEITREQEFALLKRMQVVPSQTVSLDWVTQAQWEKATAALPEFAKQQRAAGRGNV